jgi:hypothetical protein
MTPRPLLFGYVRLQPTDGNRQVPDVRRRMRAYAQAEGFTLAELLVEHDPAGTAAFAGLLGLIAKYPGSTVVVPALAHFARLESLQQAMTLLIWREAGARVVELQPTTVGTS